ncbi:hypothetical protein T492DRAFT_1078863 [Pavlovales sp. CCMP2436]|nr:hypothetical protein T492DRAFT_1078863 [Pavlovales sp. CCMP2436]
MEAGVSPRTGGATAKHPSEPTDAPQPHARVVGMHEGITPEQVEIVSRMLLDEFASVSWDGDCVRRDCFTEALVPFIERARARGDMARTVLPVCLHDSDGSQTNRGEFASVAPRSLPVSREQYAEAAHWLDAHLHPDWRRGFAGEMEGYMTLAVTHRKAARPSVVIWILDDERSMARYHAWVCLGEFRAFGGMHGATPIRLIAKDGHVLSAQEVEQMPWFPRSVEGTPWLPSEDPFSEQ